MAAGCEGGKVQRYNCIGKLFCFAMANDPNRACLCIGSNFRAGMGCHCGSIGQDCGIIGNGYIIVIVGCNLLIGVAGYRYADCRGFSLGNRYIVRGGNGIHIGLHGNAFNGNDLISGDVCDGINTIFCGQFGIIRLDHRSTFIAVVYRYGERETAALGNRTVAAIRSCDGIADTFRKGHSVGIGNCGNSFNSDGLSIRDIFNGVNTIHRGDLCAVGLDHRSALVAFVHRNREGKAAALGYGAGAAFGCGNGIAFALSQCDFIGFRFRFHRSAVHHYSDGFRTAVISGLRCVHNLCLAVFQAAGMCETVAGICTAVDIGREHADHRGLTINRNRC